VTYNRMALVQTYNSSRLPAAEKNAMSQFGSRRVLGDITGQQTNAMQLKNNKPGKEKVEPKRPRLARLAKAGLGVEDAKIEKTVLPKKGILPLGVRDIDRADEKNPQLCSEYAMEMFAYLRTLEEKTFLRAGHLSGSLTSEKMRAVLIDWLVEVQIQFKLLQETLFGTIEILDRYMAIEGKSISRDRLQLVGVSCMFLAAKIEEVYAPAISDFVYITDDAYTQNDIKKTEIKILEALQFNLFRPLSLHFLRRYSKAGDVDVLQHSLAKYALEVALLDYSLVSVSGSELAASALFLSLLLLEPESNSNTVWSPTLVYYSSYRRDKLLPTVAKLALGIVGIAEKSCKLQGVRTKYQSSKFLKVADLPELKGGVLRKLAGL